MSLDGKLIVFGSGSRGKVKQSQNNFETEVFGDNSEVGYNYAAQPYFFLDPNEGYLRARFTAKKGGTPTQHFMSYKTRSKSVIKHLQIDYQKIKESSRVHENVPELVNLTTKERSFLDKILKINLDDFQPVQIQDMDRIIEELQRESFPIIIGTKDVPMWSIKAVLTLRKKLDSLSEDYTGEKLNYAVLTEANKLSYGIGKDTREKYKIGGYPEPNIVFAMDKPAGRLVQSSSQGSSSGGIISRIFG